MVCGPLYLCNKLTITNAFRSILHNEKLYPQPEKFIPDRFIKDGKLNPDVPDPMLNGGVFGAGRRYGAP